MAESINNKTIISLNHQMQQTSSLKQMDTEINRVKNRLRKLQKRSQAEKQSFEHNNALKNEILLKKLAIAQSLRSEEDQIEEQKRQQEQRLKLLRLKNLRLRHSQKEEITNVMKAVYCVKADDAREVRKLSLEHRERIKELNRSSVEDNRSRRQRIRSQNGKAEQYWKDKLSKVYLQNHLQKIENQRAVSSKKRELQQLIEQEDYLRQELTKNQLISSQSKHERIGMMALPIREVASVLEVHQKLKPTEKEARGKSGEPNQRKAKDLDIELMELPEEHVIPKTEVSEVKLKIVLEKLRKRKQ